MGIAHLDSVRAINPKLDSASFHLLEIGLSHILYNNGLRDEAAPKYFRAYSFFRDHDHEIRANFLKMDVANVYNRQGDHAQADSILADCIVQLESLGLLQSVMSAMYNRAIVKEQLGQVEEYLQLLNEVDSLATIYDDQEQLLQIAYEKGFYEHSNGRLERALAITKSALGEPQIEGKGKIRLKLQILEGLILEELQRFEEALPIQALALEKAVENEQWNLAYRSAYYLSYVYQGLGRESEATEAMRSASNYYGKHISVQRDTRTHLLRFQFDTAEKNRTIAEQRATNLQTENDLLQTRQTLWIGGAVGLFFIGLFFIGFQVQRNKRKTAQIEAAAAEEMVDRKVSDLMQKHRYDKLVATIQGEEKERDRLAKEVHDGVGGTISGIAMQLESEDLLSDNEKIKSLAASLRMAHDDLRNIAHNLSIPSIENNTLVELVTNLLNNVQASHDIKVSLVVFPSDKPLELESQLEVMLYRIAQEAINNVLKHAGASTLDIQITKHESDVQMIVEDDGSGFEESTDGIGLRNMQERAEALSGKFNVDSRPGRGTIITVEVPLS